MAQVCELEQLVIESKTREEEVTLRLTSTLRHPVNIVKTSDPDKMRSAPTLASTPSQHQVPKGKNPDLTQYQRASSVLPAESSIKRVMVGPNPDGPDSSNSELSSDDDELSSTESEDKIKPKKTLKSKTPKDTNSLPEGDFGVDFLTLEPESDHDSDLTETKCAK
jgi:hypothetical protein